MQAAALFTNVLQTLEQCGFISWNMTHQALVAAEGFIEQIGPAMLIP